MPDPIRWGLDNLHPLSQMKTELVWAGKYDTSGRRVAILRYFGEQPLYPRGTPAGWRKNKDTPQRYTRRSA
jgi:hypothetical protein